MSAENTSFALTATQRRLKAIVVVLGVLIVLAFGALIGGFVIRLMGGGAHSGRPYVSEIPVEKGASVVATELNDGRIALRMKSSTGEEVIIVDAASGREIGRVRLSPKS